MRKVKKVQQPQSLTLNEFYAKDSEVSSEEITSDEAEDDDESESSEEEEEEEEEEEVEDEEGTSACSLMKKDARDEYIIELLT